MCHCDGSGLSVSDMAIHVHAVRLDVAPAERGACWGVLSDDERDRARRFANQELRDRWVVSRAGLRGIIGSYAGSTPQLLRFAYEELGKPVLVDRGDDSNLYFNLSHSHNLAIVAVTAVAPVGVDLEFVKPIPDWKRVAHRFFSRGENAELADVGECQRELAFYHCWTRKEAVIKSTGEGLSACLDAFDVSLAPGVQAAVLCDRRRTRPEPPWRLKNLDIGAGFVGAVAMQSSNEVTVTNHGFWKIGKV
jgi:4'-phosphopantetheinyl transferase